MEEKLKKIFEYYGATHQRKKLCEEFMELQDELLNHVKEQPEMNFKIDRQLDRISNESN